MHNLFYSCQITTNSQKFEPQSIFQYETQHGFHIENPNKNTENNNLRFFQKRCHFDSTCIPYSNFKKVNPSSTIIVDGACTSGCPDLTVLTYAYTVSFTLQENLTSSVVWQTLPSTIGLISGKRYPFCLNEFKLKIFFLLIKRS